MRNDIMEKHEMMSLEDSGQLRDKMRFFEQELLKNHHIDPNLYVCLLYTSDAADD